jgi:DNA-binding IclR family transcriptional regulator
VRRVVFHHLDSYPTPRDTVAETVQSLERAAAILGVLADRHHAGARLADVAAATGLSRSTAHRLLTALVRLGLAEQDATSGGYFPGLMLLSLGAAAADRHNLAELAAPYSQRLADRTGDTVYVALRSGNDAVCVDRLEGGFPIKVMTWNVGDRRPMGVSASGLAMLGVLGDEEVAHIVEANAARIAALTGQDRAGVLGLVAETRRAGYAFNAGYSAPGMAAVAVPICSARGEPVGALCVAALATRLDAQRRATVVGWLTEEVAELTKRLNEVTNGLSAPLMRRLRPR